MVTMYQLSHMPAFSAFYSVNCLTQLSRINFLAWPDNYDTYDNKILISVTCLLSMPLSRLFNITLEANFLHGQVFIITQNLI